MIETALRLGNFQRFCTLALALLALSGCADMFFSLVGSGADTRNIALHGDIPFDTQHGLALDVYAPKRAAGAPLVVFFYGGSWVEGHRHWYRYVGTALANHGVIAVIPDYRKYPQVQ